jgi:hypothetical protein
LVCGGVPRNRGEDALRQALKDMGNGPFWLRPSDAAGSKSGLMALKPLSLEQVVRTVFTSVSDKKFFIVQKALKVSALGICRTHPQKGMTLSDVDIRMTSVSTGSEMMLRITPEKGVMNGLLDAPWKYFPKEFPLKGFELFEVVQLTRRLATHLEQFAEVEWVLSEGRVYVLDGRPIRESDRS